MNKRLDCGFPRGIAKRACIRRRDGWLEYTATGIRIRPPRSAAAKRLQLTNVLGGLPFFQFK